MRVISRIHFGGPYRSQPHELDVGTGAFLEETEAEEVREQLLELYFHVRAFLNIYDILDEHYVIYTELETDDSFLLKLFCVNSGSESPGVFI